jgi:hypothetical protein
LFLTPKTAESFQKSVFDSLAGCQRRDRHPARVGGEEGLTLTIIVIIIPIIKEVLTNVKRKGKQTWN